LQTYLGWRSYSLSLLDNEFGGYRAEAHLPFWPIVHDSVVQTQTQCRDELTVLKLPTDQSFTRVKEGISNSTSHLEKMKAELKGELVLAMFGNVICTDLGPIGPRRVATNILNKRACIGNLSTIDNRGYPFTCPVNLITGRIITISSRERVNIFDKSGLWVHLW
jgi:hypothetical protein